MTLILTAICKDGTCVCADKRYKITASDGSVKYESSDRWVGKDHSQIVSDFKEFIEEYVKKELARYKDNEKHAIGFLLGGRPTSENNYKISEIHWLLEKGGIKFTPPDVIHTRKKNNLIFTGEDNIKDYLKKHVESNVAQYSKMSRAQRAGKKLTDLFNLAVKKKQKPDTEDFSDNYDVEIVAE